ncbi:MAG: hypothetical protein QMC77_07620 [Methanocellales archaeon]|nr:hypothetical protein [Methanocellales archaeon]
MLEFLDTKYDKYLFVAMIIGVILVGVIAIPIWCGYIGPLSDEYSQTTSKTFYFKVNNTTFAECKLQVKCSAKAGIDDNENVKVEIKGWFYDPNNRFEHEKFSFPIYFEDARVTNTDLIGHVDVIATPFPDKHRLEGYGNITFYSDGLKEIYTHNP